MNLPGCSRINFSNRQKNNQRWSKECILTCLYLNIFLRFAFVLLGYFWLNDTRLSRGLFLFGIFAWASMFQKKIYCICCRQKHLFFLRKLVHYFRTLVRAAQSEYIAPALRSCHHTSNGHQQAWCGSV